MTSGRALGLDCTLYVHRNNEQRLLYVCETADFPFADFDKIAWRLVAHGVEPPPSAKRALKRSSYYEVWRRAEEDETASD